MVYENGMYGKGVWLFRIALAQFVLLVLLALEFVYLPFPFFSKVAPTFFLMGVYYWSVYRPSLLPPVAVFVAGLGYDLLTMSPVGLNAFIFLLAYLFARRQRRFLTGQSFFTFWLGFLFVCALTSLLRWGVAGLPSMMWVSLDPVWINVAISFFLFPFVVLFLILVHKVLPASR